METIIGIFIIILIIGSFVGVTIYGFIRGIRQLLVFLGLVKRALDDRDIIDK